MNCILKDLVKLKLTLFSRICEILIDEPLKIPGSFREFYKVASFLKNSQEMLGILENYPSLPENSWESFRTGMLCLKGYCSFCRVVAGGG